MNRRLPMYMIAAILIMAVSVRLVGAEEKCVVQTVTEEIKISPDWPDWTEWYRKLEISAEKLTIGRGEGINLWCFTEGGSSCPPFNWNVSGTGFHFYGVAGPTTGETEEELEIITLYADNNACGTATITVTDSCGDTSTAYIRCTTGKWTRISTEFCSQMIDGSTPGQCCKQTSEVIVGKYRYRDSWMGGPYPCRITGGGSGVYCSKWSYTTDKSDKCCYYVGFYPCFPTTWLGHHTLDEWVCP